MKTHPLFLTRQRERDIEKQRETDKDSELQGVKKSKEFKRMSKEFKRMEKRYLANINKNTNIKSKRKEERTID